MGVVLAEERFGFVGSHLIVEGQTAPRRPLIRLVTKASEEPLVVLSIETEKLRHRCIDGAAEIDPLGVTNERGQLTIQGL